MEQYCFRSFADAMEVIPFTLAENAGLNPIATVTDLRNRHAKGEKNTGINVRKVISIWANDAFILFSVMGNKKIKINNIYI